MKRQRLQQPTVLSPVTQSVLVSPKEESGGIFQRQRFQLTDEEDGGKHSTVLFATRTMTPSRPAQKFAIKKQIIQSPYNISDKSYRELFILQQLNQLKNRKDYYPGDISFVGFVDWFKAKEDDQYMHYILERADFTLNDIKGATLHEYKSLFFQVLFALYVAQTEYEFMHNDLHKKNVLLVQPPEGREMEYNSFKDEDATWFTTGLAVKITDFGLSRIRLDNQRVICDEKKKATSIFDPHQDVEQVFTEFRTIKILPDSWVTDLEVDEIIKKLSDQGEVPPSREEIKGNLAKERQKQLNDLRRMQRLGYGLKELIHHEFFVSLRERKPDFLSPQHKRRKLAFEEANENDCDFLRVSPESSPTSEKAKLRKKSSPFREVKNEENRINFSPVRLNQQFSNPQILTDSPSFRNSQKRTKPVFNLSQLNGVLPSNSGTPPRNQNPFSTPFFTSTETAVVPMELEEENITNQETNTLPIENNENIRDLPRPTPRGRGRARAQRTAVIEPVRRSARLQSKQPR